MACAGAKPKPVPPPATTPPPPPTPRVTVQVGKYCGFTDSGGGICFDVGAGASGQYMTNARFDETTTCQPERRFKITVTLTAQQVTLGGDLAVTYNSTGSLAGSRVSGVIDTQGGARGSLTMRYVFDRDGTRYTCSQETAWSARSSASPTPIQ